MEMPKSRSYTQENQIRTEHGHNLDDGPQPGESNMHPEQSAVTPVAIPVLQEGSMYDGPVDTKNRNGVEPSESEGERPQLQLQPQTHLVPTATGTHGAVSLDGYYLSLQQRASPGRRQLINGPLASPQLSCGSLQALMEHEVSDTSQSLRRTHSTKSAGQIRARSISHSKASSISQIVPRRLQGEPGFYPEQSFASLSNSHIPPRPHPILRTRSSHPAQNILYNDVKGIKPSAAAGRKTADNTPMSSPGLFTPTFVRQQFETRSGSPQLHHLQAPKETHTAEIEHDVYSGNKFINNYEVVTELGRGEHGKVKLGRDIERDNMVAIKIVPRYSAKRRLGKLGAPEDRTKREVAILKKARHPHVVSLLEVIDDPNKNKVYLILEFVDKGEIKWRKHGVKEVCSVNNRRFDEERRGFHVSMEALDRETFAVSQARQRHERLERVRSQAPPTHVPNWSLEYAGDTDDESEMLEMTRSISRQMTNSSNPSRGNSQDDYMGTNEHPLSGSMYGVYAPDAYRNRKFSIAASAVSHMSSEVAFDQDDDQHSFVPALTMEEAKNTFRDTLLGLEFLHSIGIIHRDIKPANLLMSSTGIVKISDFGVSYLGRPTTEEEADNKVSESDATPMDDEKELARSVGTPAFWAPEVCYEDPGMFADGKDPKITGALDLWALGITLYCMIYARLPFYSSEGTGLHESVCTEDVFCPRTRLVPVDTASSEFITRAKEPINSNKRLDYELRFEVVPDHVCELISRLLTKDPARRITIQEAKRHPWVVEGIVDQSEWLHTAETPENATRILEPNEREMSHAVVKRNIIERTLTAASRIAGSILGRSKDNRKRASSTATSAGSSSESLHSPATSSASTIGKNERLKEARRTSLRGDELVQALKASREMPEHPLAQSQTASPEVKETAEQSYFTVPDMQPTGHIASPDSERRPRGPDRAASVLSTAESVKTIRASQFQRGPLSDSSSSTEIGPETSFKSRIDGLWEGTNRSLQRLSSRSRTSRSRSRSRPPSESDGHAGPSLAISNTYAAGAIATPNILRPVEPASPARSVQHQSPFRAPASAELEYEHAQQINHRRHIQEAQIKAESESGALILDIDPVSSMAECPPSPDDEAFIERSLASPVHVSPPEGGMQTAISASTIASSLEGDYSSVSLPSYGMNSGASSPPEGFLSAEYKDIVPHQPAIHTADMEPEFMRTADTVTTHDRIQPAVVTGKPLQQEHEYYEDGDDEDDSSEEEGIVMGGPRRC